MIETADPVQVAELPEEPESGATYEIMSNDTGYFTHGFFKYPAKYIPQVPRWGIMKYSSPGDYVLDPFAGSGTSLVEAVINGRNGLGIDFDSLSRLLCRAKTQKLDSDQLDLLRNLIIKGFPIKEMPGMFRPGINNLEHWFTEENIKALSATKEKIEDIYRNTGDEMVYSLLLVAFASIIKRCSNADSVSPKPYVSTKIRKVPAHVHDLFLKTLNAYLTSYEKFRGDITVTMEIIGEDATDINSPELNGKVAVAVTSPPYINAFDYVRSLRLENAWLGFRSDPEFAEVKKKQVGTENIPVSETAKPPGGTGIAELDRVVSGLYRTDRKRAHVVHRFFTDMDRNMAEVRKLLKSDGHYVIVIGDTAIRGVPVRTHDLLAQIAERQGYRLVSSFSYVIKNRYLRIPREGNGGLVEKDWIIDLVR